MKSKKLISLLCAVAMLSAMFIVPAQAATLTTTEYGRVFDGSTADNEYFDFIPATGKTISWTGSSWGNAGWDWAVISKDKVDAMPEEFTLTTNMGVGIRNVFIYFNAELVTPTTAPTGGNVLEQTEGYRLNMNNESKILKLAKYKSGELSYLTPSDKSLTMTDAGDGYASVDTTGGQRTITKEIIDGGYKITYTTPKASYEFTDTTPDTVKGGKAAVNFNSNWSSISSLTWKNTVTDYPAKVESYTFANMTQPEVDANFVGTKVSSIKDDNIVSMSGGSTLGFNKVLGGTYTVELNGLHLATPSWGGYSLTFNDDGTNKYKVSLREKTKETVDGKEVEKIWLVLSKTGTSDPLAKWEYSIGYDISSLKVTSAPQANGDLKITVNVDGKTFSYIDTKASSPLTSGKFTCVMNGSGDDPTKSKTPTTLKTFAVAHYDNEFSTPEVRKTSYTFKDMTKADVLANFDGTNVATINTDSLVSKKIGSYLRYLNVLNGDYSVEYKNLTFATPTWDHYYIEFNHNDINGSTGYRYYPVTNQLVKYVGTTEDELWPEDKNAKGEVDKDTYGASVKITSTPSTDGSSLDIKIVREKRNGANAVSTNVINVSDDAPVSTFGTTRCVMNGSEKDEANTKTYLGGFEVTYNGVTNTENDSITLSNVTKGTDGKVSGTVSYVAKESDYVVVVAVYDGNDKMLGVTVPTNVTDLDHRQFTIAGASTATYCKAFLWDSMDTLRPLCGANRVDVTVAE